MCTETADNVLRPSVPVARVDHREAKIHGGRPHMVCSKSYPMPSPVMYRQTLILATIYCWSCRRTTIIVTGQAIGTPRTRTQPCQTPKHRTIRAATENGVDTAAGTSKSSLACVLNSRESGHRRVNHHNNGERSGSSRIEQLNVSHRKKGEADTAVSSTSSGETPHDDHTTARERNPQRERRQPSQIPQHRTTHPQPQSKTRTETAISSNSSVNHRPFPMHNGECPQAAKRVDTATQDNAASHS